MVTCGSISRTNLEDAAIVTCACCKLPIGRWGAIQHAFLLDASSGVFELDEGGSSRFPH